MDKKLIVISLIGIPASGKTSLSQRIQNFSENGSILYEVIRISFDDYMKLNYEDINEGDYKISRNLLLKRIELFLRGVQERQDSEDFGFKFLHHETSKIVIIDDTNHFRSMRQKLRALCRNVGCEYFQIFIDTPLNTAKMRNHERMTKIPDPVIEKIHGILEKPRNQRTIVIETSISDDDLIELLEERIKNPENLEAAQHLKTPQEQSFIHEADIITRKELNMKIQTLRLQPNFSQQLCRELNQKRQQFIDDLRTMKIYADEVDSLRHLFDDYMNFN